MNENNILDASSEENVEESEMKKLEREEYVFVKYNEINKNSDQLDKSLRIYKDREKNDEENII